MAAPVLVSGASLGHRAGPEHLREGGRPSVGDRATRGHVGLRFLERGDRVGREGSVGSAAPSFGSMWLLAAREASGGVAARVATASR